MTISVALFRWIGRSISFRQRMAMQDLFAHTPREDIFSLVKSIVFFTLRRGNYRSSFFIHSLEQLLFLAQGSLYSYFSFCFRILQCRFLLVCEQHDGLQWRPTPQYCYLRLDRYWRHRFSGSLRSSILDA